MQFPKPSEGATSSIVVIEDDDVDVQDSQQNHDTDDVDQPIAAIPQLQFDDAGCRFFVVDRDRPSTSAATATSAPVRSAGSSLGSGSATLTPRMKKKPSATESSKQCETLLTTVNDIIHNLQPRRAAPVILNRIKQITQGLVDSQLLLMREIDEDLWFEYVRQSTSILEKFVIKSQQKRRTGSLLQPPAAPRAATPVALVHQPAVQQPILQQAVVQQPLVQQPNMYSTASFLPIQPTPSSSTTTMMMQPSQLFTQEQTPQQQESYAQLIFTDIQPSVTKLHPFNITRSTFFEDVDVNRNNYCHLR